jgi:hypothetical protein
MLAQHSGHVWRRTGKARCPAIVATFPNARVVSAQAALAWSRVQDAREGACDRSCHAPGCGSGRCAGDRLPLYAKGT